LFKNLTYKKKNQLLIIGSILLAAIVYYFAIKKTIDAYEKFSDCSQKMKFASSAPMMAAKMEKELTVMNEKMSNQNKSGQNTAQVLLELVTNYCQKNHAVLREFPQTSSSNKENLLIETNRFIVQGDFATLINLVYDLEQKNKLGKVASVHYQLKKDFITKEMALTSTVFLQNVKKQ
jgi:hypothetical protein